MLQRESHLRLTAVIASGGVLSLKTGSMVRPNRQPIGCAKADACQDAVAITSAESQLLSVFPVAGVIVIIISGG